MRREREGGEEGEAQEENPRSYTKPGNECLSSIVGAGSTKV